MDNEEISIANHLKDLRKKYSLSQEDLAESLGITRQSIIALEQGRFMPSLPLAATICRFFNSAFEDIFEFDLEIKQTIDQLFNEDEKNHKINIINNNDPALPASMAGLSGAREETAMPQELGPWRPLREVVSLRDAMDRLFEDSVITPKGGSVGTPKIDIKDKKDHVEVKAELPGMAEDEIDIEIADGVMTISGERKSEEEKEGEGYYYRESHTGAFSRSFSLPADIKEDKAEADMKNGILTISIPKVAPKKATRVKVSTVKKPEKK